MTDEAAALWKSISGHVAEQVSEVVWQTTFREIKGMSFDGHALTLQAPSILARDRIENRYRELLSAAMTDAGLDRYDLIIEVDPTVEAILAPDPVAVVRPDGMNAGDGGAVSPSAYNPKYTFESFVTGPSNRFAQAAALSVAETPARSYNPLFVYGSAGLGKTHLLQAIANYVIVNYPAYRVRYISTEELLNEFVDAIRNGNTSDFKRRFREIDVLLVDDIQFMEGKEQLQEEFFYTFNTLHEANRQIVLSSDRPPDAIATLEDRLRSRFKMGLITDIQPPDLETRLAIVRKKSEQSKTPLPHPVLEFIVTHITNNIREIEGALNRVTAFANLTRTTPNLAMAKEVLGDIVSNGDQRPITADQILEATATKYGFTVEELKSKSRRRPLVTARQIGMYLFRELTDLSYPQTALIFGGRDHTTVIHAYEKIRNLMNERASIYQDVQSLIQELKSNNGRS